MRLRPLFPPRAGRGLVLLAALACASCSGGGSALNPVRGQVLYKGQPLKGAVVTFHPKAGGKSFTTLLPVGMTGEDGSFTLATGDKEGAPAGEYVVTLICPEDVAVPKGKILTAPPESRDRLQGAYASRETSTLQRQVKAGSNQLEPLSLK